MVQFKILNFLVITSYVTSITSKAVISNEIVVNDFYYYCYCLVQCIILYIKEMEYIQALLRVTYKGLFLICDLETRTLFSIFIYNMYICFLTIITDQHLILFAADNYNESKRHLLFFKLIIIIYTQWLCLRTRFRRRFFFFC